MREGPTAASLPQMYEGFLVAPLFRPFAQELLNRVGIGLNDRLLDVACGTGVVGRLARDTIGNRGRIVGVDASPGMVGMARTVAPALEWREGDAAHLPVSEDETFDIVTCHQGLQFFADKAAAVQEMRRVLAPRGRLAVATWRAVEEIPLMRELQKVAERRLGAVVDQRHSFGDANAIGRLLADAGFRAIQVGTVSRTIRIGDGTVFLKLNAMAIVGMSATGKAMSQEQRTQVTAAITNESVDATQPYLDGTELVFDLLSTIACAQA